MPILAQVQEIIDQIILATPDITPELKGVLQDELQEQFDQLLSQTVIDSLPADQVETFERLLAVKPLPDQGQVQQFLRQNNLDGDTLMLQAATKLKEQYLG